MSARRHPHPAWILTLLAALCAIGCERDEARPMVDQPRYDPLEPSRFFDSGTSARQPIPGTIGRDSWVENPAFNTGETQDGLVRRVPVEITQAMLERGKTRYGIYCTPCHGYAGYGEGMIVQRGYTKPPSFHIDRLRAAPAGHFFTVITNGLGRMPSYAAQVPTADRWAIVAYIRALQLSQHMRVQTLPPSGNTGESKNTSDTQ